MKARGEEPAKSAISQASLWPALMVAVLVITGALVFGHLLRGREVRALEAATARVQRRVASEVEVRMRESADALERLAANWERSGGLSRAEFEGQAGRLAQDYSFLQAIGWVDPKLRVRWIVPRAGNEAAEGLDLGFEARRREALQASRDERAIHISRPIQLVQGGLGMNGYIPLHVGDRFDGFVGGVWRAGDLFSHLLGNVAPGFGIRISDEEERLYERDTDDALWTSAHEGQSHAPIGRPWSIEVAPLPAVVAIYRTPLPLLIVVGGIVFGLGFAFTLQLARSRRIHNRQLRAEIRRRTAVEQDLSRVIEAIPDDVWRIEVTPDGIRTLYYSERIAILAGGTLDRFSSSLETWYEKVHPADLANIKRLYVELTSGQRDTVDFEYRILAADGSLVWLHERAYGTPSPRGTFIDGITSNITEAKRLEFEHLKRQKEDLLLSERARMMREMHDGLGGQLVSTIAMVESGQSTQREVTESLRRALDDMRVVLDTFDATTPDLTSTLGKLRARLDPLLRRNGLVLRWQVEDVPGSDGFPPELTLHFLRIIQEAVTNALRHANASEVSVRVRAGDPNGETLQVEISDDGCGLPSDCSARGRGLANMKSRAAALGAELRLSRLDPGTRIELRVPIPGQPTR